ncbi:MAG: hypothetical protein OSJ58_10715 [Dysosmobacter sp.]|nr:hypothetical protein [Dysosmobacter sp.]
MKRTGKHPFKRYVLPSLETASRQSLRQGKKAAMRRAGMVYIDAAGRDHPPEW